MGEGKGGDEWHYSSAGEKNHLRPRTNPVDEKLAFIYSTFDLLSYRQRRKAR